DLLHKGIGQALAGDDRKARNVVDRLLGIKLGALAADLVENVDDMGLDVEQAEFEHGKQPAWAGPDDDRIGLDGPSHSSVRLDGGAPHAPAEMWRLSRPPGPRGEARTARMEEVQTEPHPEPNAAGVRVEGWLRVRCSPPSFDTRTPCAAQDEGR